MNQVDFERERADLYKRRPPLREAFKHTRWVFCTVCEKKGRVAVSSAKGRRLRDRSSPCCGARMRPRGWRPKQRVLPD